MDLHGKTRKLSRIHVIATRNERASCVRRSSSRNPSLNNTRTQLMNDLSRKSSPVHGKDDFRKLEQMVMCKVCFDRDSCMILFPCRHMATCEYCTKFLQHCAVCRAPIREEVKINFD